MSLPNRTMSVARKATATRTKYNENASLIKRRHRQKLGRVSFSKLVTITEVPTRRTYTSDERLSVWYTKSEYRCFRLQENIRNLKARNKSGLSNRVVDDGYQSLSAQRAIQHKRTHGGMNTNHDVRKSAKITDKFQGALSRVFESRKSTSGQFGQSHWQMHPSASFVPESLKPSGPIESVSASAMFASAMRAKHHMIQSQILFDLSKIDSKIEPSSLRH